MTTFENTINNIRNILRNEGITGMDSIAHCIAFVLIRYLTEDKCKYFNIPIKYSYNNFLIDDKTKEPYPSGDSRIIPKFYSTDAEDDDLLSHLRNKFNFTQLSFKLNSPFNFENILKKLKDININEISKDYDIVGMIYEFHLKTGSSNSMRDLGQYFTHRKVIKFMIDLCKPKLKKDGSIETILDPSMGTCGFLSMILKYLNKKYKNIDWSVNKNNIYGFDIDNNIRNLALLNILLESGEVCDKTLINRDTLRCDYSIEKVDIILANPPFGLKQIKYKDCCSRIKDMKIEGTKSEPLFLQLMLKSLNKNGRCAVIVPDGVLFNDAKLYKDTRKYLIENLNLKKVISLGDKLFLNTGVKSSILFFVNDGKTSKVDFTEIKLVNNEIVETEIVNVSYDELVKNNYYLGLNKYLKDVSSKIESVEYKKLGDICTFLSKSKRQASYGKDYGNYKFFTSSLNYKYCDDADYKQEALIFGTGGNANIKLATNFSCSADNFIITSEKINNKYLYYWFLSNMNILNNFFHGSVIKHLSKSDLESIKIPIPSIELQQEIVNSLDLYYEQLEINKKSIETYTKLKKSIIWSNVINCEEKKLSELISVKQGEYITKNDMIEGEYGVYGGGNATYYINKYNNENKLIIAKDGVSENCIRWIKNKFFVNHHAWTINLLDNILLEKYVYYYLWNIQNKIYLLAEGSAQKGINQKNFLNIKIPILSIQVQNNIINECEYFDEQIDKLKKENKMLENNNIIELILNSI
jgi:type I restriction-modification system DNA methylase subunit/restriction endonuclease S subunit